MAVDEQPGGAARTVDDSGEGVVVGDPPIVELDNVEIVYDKHFLAVQGLSLEANRGDIVALLGPNGAGKSTVLKMISGIGRSERGEVSRGSVHYEGREVTNARPKTMVDRGVTHVLEERRVFEDLTVEENLRCGLYRSGRRFRFDVSDYELAFEYFPQLEEILDINAGYASGGQQQMLVIARALLSLTETGAAEVDARDFEATLRREGEAADDASSTLATGESTTLEVGGVTVQARFEDDLTLSGAITDDAGAVPETDPTAPPPSLVLELERPAGQSCRREVDLSPLETRSSIDFAFDATPPALLLLDEPSLGLAPQLVEDIFQKLVEINARENITMIVADQNAEKTLSMADYGYVMENGQVELHDPADELKGREEIKEYYLGTSEGGDRYKDIRHYKIKKRWS